jgi:hypothetical protein
MNSNTFEAAVQAPLDSFTYFPKLPQEVKTMIWKDVLPAARREIRISFETTKVDETPCILSLWHVCHEGRAVTLNNYSVLDLNIPVYVNLDIDVISIAKLADLQVLRSFLISNDGRGLQWEDMTQNLRYLFVRRFPWLDRRASNSITVRELQQLESLVFWEPCPVQVVSYMNYTEDQINKTRDGYGPQLRIHFACKNYSDKPFMEIEFYRKWWTREDHARKVRDNEEYR